MDQFALRNGLDQFYGSQEMYRHSLNRSVIYTEGVQFFAENAGGGAYWLLDILATEPAILAQQKEFASIRLTVLNKRALLLVTDGNDDSPPAYRREIEFTDCPEGEWQFFFTDNTIMLPSEY